MTNYTYWYAKRTSRKILAYNDEDECLGSLNLQHVGKHMHWRWHQNVYIGMSGGCLDEVRKIQKLAFKYRNKDKWSEIQKELDKHNKNEQ